MLKAEKLKLETDYADDTDAECRKPARGRSSSVNSVASVLKTSESVSAFSVSVFQLFLPDSLGFGVWVLALCQGSCSTTNHKA
jgi:hypothetical protein